MYSAPNGSNANQGAQVSLKKASSARQILEAAEARVESIVISVPPGTVVRRKRTGTLLADLTRNVSQAPHRVPPMESSFVQRQYISARHTVWASSVIFPEITAYAITD
jgi:hypothetical protein